MTDPSRRDGWGQEHPGTYNYPAYPGSTYGQQAPAGSEPTQQLPAYSPYGYAPYTTGPYGPPNPPGGEPPEPPKPDGPNPRRWLYVLAGLALLTVLGLVIGLVIVNSSQQNTVVAPPQTPIEPTITAPPSTTTTPIPTTSSTEPQPPTTTPGLTPAPGQTTTPGGTHTVVYSVGGEGRAISILYLDSGGVLQTEFNVMLPWTKQVQLAGQANGMASVSIVNVGHEVTCSITIDGASTQQNTGTGLTLCTSLGTH